MSGNPKGLRKRKTPSLAADLRALLQRALNMKIRGGDHDQIVTNAAAGIERLVTQFATGDRRARRDVIVLAEKLGVDLTADQTAAKVVTAALDAEDDASIKDYLRRHGVELKDQAENAESPADQNNESTRRP
jgi:Family of unknown function (DUF5681)